jgi:hypothetical protein
MSEQKAGTIEQTVSRDRLAELLNEDLAREYQAISVTWCILRS